MNARGRGGLAAIVLALWSSVSCQQIQDVCDKRDLRRLFVVIRSSY